MARCFLKYKEKVHLNWPKVIWKDLLIDRSLKFSSSGAQNKFSKQTNCKNAPGLFSYHGLFPYLEDKHLSSQYGEGVEAPITDVGFRVRVRWSISWGQPRRTCLPVWLAGVWRWMGAGWGCGWQRLGGLGNLIRRSWIKTRRQEKYCLMQYKYLQDVVLTRRE